MASLKLFYFAYLAALGAFSPFFGPFLTARGFSEWQLGLIMSLWYGTRALAPGLWDMGVTRSKQPIYWLRAGALGVLFATAGFLPHWPFAGMVCVMLVFAGLYNAIMPQYEALTLQHLAKTPERYSGVRLYGSVGFFLVVLGFGALFRRVGVDYLIWAMLPLTCLLVWASFLSRYPAFAQPTVGESRFADPAFAQPKSTPLPLCPHTETALSNGEPRSKLARALTPGMCALLWIGLCNQIAHGPLYVYFSVYLIKHGFDAFQVGLLWSVSVLCEIFAFMLMRRALMRFATQHIMALSLVAGALRWWVIGTFPDVGAVLAIAQVLHALTFAAMHASFMQLMARSVSAADLGFAQALFYSIASGVGGVAGALIAGWCWQHSGDQSSFYVAAAFSLLALIALPYLGRGPAGTNENNA
jgi:MFS transporter, PPP family, 3-phenylpropionic acid transporter